MRALLLYNPVAGRLSVRPFVHRAASALKRFGWKVKVAPTRSGAHATELARKAAADGLDVVFAAGGDGTMGQVAAGLAGSETALGILPAGTTNVLAIELGLRPFGWSRPWALEENIIRLAQSPVHAVDLGLCNDRPFLLWAGLGLDAMTIQKLEPRNRWEKYLSVPEYAAHTIWNAAFWPGMDLRVKADGNTVEGHFLVAVITNIRTYLGGLATISPQACLDDDEMDLWLFSGNNLGDAFRHSFGMMAGRHLTAPDAQRIPFRHLEIESEIPFSLQQDGEPFQPHKQIKVEILAQQLRLMLPEESLGLLKQGHAQGIPSIISERQG